MYCWQNFQTYCVLKTSKFLLDDCTAYAFALVSISHRKPGYWDCLHCSSGTLNFIYCYKVNLVIWLTVPYLTWVALLFECEIIPPISYVICVEGGKTINAVCLSLLQFIRLVHYQPICIWPDRLFTSVIIRNNYKMLQLAVYNLYLQFTSK